MERTRSRRRRTSHALALMAVCGAMVGCVERRYTIRTNVPGALAIVNGEEIGPTPVSRSFTYYAPRRITLIADNFETLDVIQPMPAPWWNNLITEFITENLIPITFRDERDYYYELKPATVPSTTDLQNRAEALRQSGQSPPPPRRRGLLGLLGF